MLIQVDIQIYSNRQTYKN